MGEELKGFYLDKAVAVALGANDYTNFDKPNTWPVRTYGDICQQASVIKPDGTVLSWRTFSPSTRWSDIGPLIEKYKIAFMIADGGVNAISDGWSRSGENHLIAACRVIVATCN